MPLGLELDVPIVYIDPDVIALARVPSRPQDYRLGLVVSNYDGFIPFYFYPQDGVHSALQINPAGLATFIDGHTGHLARTEEWSPTRIHRLPCFRLDTILHGLQVSSVPFLKVDVQGFELRVLDGLANSLELIHFLQIEVRLTAVPLYADSPDKQQIVEWLTKRGFQLLLTQLHTWDQEADLIFVNTNYHGVKTPVSLSMIRRSSATQTTRRHPGILRRILKRRAR